MKNNAKDSDNKKDKVPDSPNGSQNDVPQESDSTVGNNTDAESLSTFYGGTSCYNQCVGAPGKDLINTI